MIILVLVSRNRYTFDKDVREKKIFFTFSFPVTFTFDLNFDIKFAPLVTLDQCHIPSKFEVSMAFLFRENRRHGTDGPVDGHCGQTDGLGATLNAPPWGGPHYNKLNTTGHRNSHATFKVRKSFQQLIHELRVTEM